MLAALRLVLFDNGNPAAPQNLALSPILTWIVLLGGAYGFCRGVHDVLRALIGRSDAPADGGRESS
jgi:hypothetical protein